MRFKWSFKHILLNSTIWHSTPEMRASIYWTFHNPYVQDKNNDAAA